MVWGILLALATVTVVVLVDRPMYRSEATVFVRTPGDVSRVVDGGDTYARSRADTYAAIANSTSLSARVIKDLDLGLEPEVLSQRIDATSPPGTALVVVAVTAPSAAEAQRTATVFLSEYGAMVRQLESVPGSLVPRAELVVVDPPGRATRIVASGLPLWAVLLGAGLIGLLAGTTAAVLRAISENRVCERPTSTHITASGPPMAASEDGANEDSDTTSRLVHAVPDPPGAADRPEGER
jgi:capsular polysaccharide biosynthesis protein